jgi:ADP-ribosylglycohydrolase
MRVGPIGYLFDTEKSVLDEATKSAQISHNHKDAITGAQVVAICIFLARHNKSKTYIKQYIENKFGYSFNETIEELRERNTFDLNCKVTVYCAIMCFLASHDFQSAIQLGLSIGGDADTICCIIGSIAEAYYKNIPEDLIEFAKERIDSRMLAVINKFYGKVKMNSKIKIIKK